MGLFNAIFGTYSEREVKRLERLAAPIEALADTYAAKSDEELREMTGILRKRLENGETTDDILPDAFAVVREADARVLGKRPYHVQLLGGIVLHQGRIAEMKTGEGKTLVATLPAYLNALTGKGVHIVTVNEYLARRDSEEMGRVYDFLGLTTGLIVQGMTTAERQKAYNADITYGTNSEFGFDYLRDNMQTRRENITQRPLHFAIVDEVDSILIDEARTPLIISGMRNESVDVYKKADAFVRSLSRFELDEMDKAYEEDRRKTDLPEERVQELRQELASFFAGLTVRSAARGKTVEEEDCDVIRGADGETGRMTRRGETKYRAHFGEMMKDKEVRAELDYLAGYALTAATRWEKDKDYRIRGNSVVPVSFRFHNALKNETGDMEVLCALGAKHGITPEFDYVVDEKNRVATLTAAGIKKAEQYFGISFGGDGETEDYTDESEALGELLPYVKQALQAHGVMERDRDYVVHRGEVLIVDHYTGRVLPGRRFSQGLHQALEAKEGVEIQGENQTIASITYQNFFRLYEKLSGMTGTALTEAEEFEEIYGLDVVEIPTNRPMIRVDHHDIVYRTEAGKYGAVLEIVRACREKGQPILIGTASVEKSEQLDAFLSKNGIKAAVLNAKNHEREAHIIAQAGTPGAVTISTNMAGRGTDILLGGNPEYLAKDALAREGVDAELIAACDGTRPTEDEALLAVRTRYRELLEKYRAEVAPAAERVREAGGLFILGTERHESRRIDDQLRGRSGRQGDPGESLFIVSLEDNLLRLFGGEMTAQRLARVSGGEDVPLQFGILTRFIRNAQKSVEGRHFQARKSVLEYDDVMNQQREVIYGERRRVLFAEDAMPIVMRMVGEYIDDVLAAWDNGRDSQALTSKLPFLLRSPEEPEGMKEKELREMLMTRAEELVNTNLGKVAEATGEPAANHARTILLATIDRLWMKHLGDMDDIRETVGLNSYAQRKPIVEYRLLGGQAFDEMIAELKKKVAETVLCLRVRVERARPTPRPMPKPAGDTGGTRRVTKKVGPNEKCPCGSGKKYKYCCGMK